MAGTGTGWHRFALRIMALLALLAWAAPVRAGDVVTGEPALVQALEQAQDGATILLGPGRYERLRLGAGLARNLTLASADPARPAEIGRMMLEGATGLTLRHLVFDYRFAPGDDLRLRPFQIVGSEEIRILDSEFRGDVARGVSATADGFGFAIGLGIHDTRGVVLERNRFHRWHRALVVGWSYDIAVLGNEFHDLRSDGMNFAAVQGVRIEGNHIHGFRASRGSSDHADMIQFWTNGTKWPSTDIVIRDNILNAGRGSWTQSIFMRNEMVDSRGAGPEMFYRNVEICGNVIVNAHLHGITVGEADGLVICNNTLLRSPFTSPPEQDGPIRYPAINVNRNAERVWITGNLARAVAGPERRAERGGGRDWVVEDNLDLQDGDPASPGYYDHVFLAPRQGDPATLAPFRYRPGGPADGRRLGAALLRPDAPLPPVLLGGVAGQPAQQDGARALFRLEQAPDQANRFGLDASASRLAPGARAAWTILDPEGRVAAQAVGPVQKIELPAPGRWQVVLQAGPSGSEAQTMAEILLPTPEILRLEAGRLLALRGDSLQEIPDMPVIRLPDGTPALRLGDDPVVRLPVAATLGLRQARDLAIDLRLRAGAGPDAAGTLLGLRGSLALAVTPTGSAEATLHLAGVKQPVVLRSRPLGLHDGRWHRIGLRHDAASGEVLLLVDDRLETRIQAAPGRMAPPGRDGLSLGHPHRGHSFQGVLSDLSVRVNGAGFAAD